MTTWKADEIDITAICEAANWHLATAIDGAMAAGFSRTDAAAFVDFVFNEQAIEGRGTVDQASEDFVTPEQWDRLS